MILRHITEHVKAQNWTAIWIEFVLLVSGVFLGIQVADWDEERKFKGVEIDTLIQISTSLAESKNNLTQAFADDERWLSCSRRILDHLDARPYSPS